jgi:hypothetical protein
MVSSHTEISGRRGDGKIMRVKRGLRALRIFLGRDGARVSDKPEWDEVERSFRHIWHHLIHISEERYSLKRRRPNALVLHMGKVASFSIRAALCERKINAFHSHRLSPMRQHHALSHLLEGNLTFRLVAHELRGHIKDIALHAMTRWYQRHKRYEGHKLKVITLTRDPVTRYPSSFVHRCDSSRPDMLAWHRARLSLRPEDPVDEAQVIPSFLMELASIIVEGRPSAGAAACGRCVALARERWPEHPVVAAEVGDWLAPLTWFDVEITPMFGLEMLASSELRERGWTERSNDWVDILALKFEELPSLVPEIQRFFDLAELTLPRENVTNAKRSAAKIASAMGAVLDTPMGQACARELRASPYARACGYDRTI